MARISRLPPPPANPVRSPSADVEGETRTFIPGTPVTPPLEARLRLPVTAKCGVVLCHPHPLYGGSMHSPIPLSIAKILREKGADEIASLRFNFRGVGESQGVYDDGNGEKEDVLAAIEHLRSLLPKGAEIHVAGHSFGSWAGLRAADADGDIESVLLIAPSTRFFPFGPEERGDVRDGPSRAKPGRRLGLFIGDRDEFCDVEEARALASKLGATFKIFEGFDHHFMKSRRALAEAAFEWIVQ